MHWEFQLPRNTVIPMLLVLFISVHTISISMCINTIICFDRQTTLKCR